MLLAPAVQFGAAAGIPLGVWCICAAFGVMFAIGLEKMIGGSIPRIIIICFGLMVLVDRYQGVPFQAALARTCRDNRWTLTLLATYYAWIVVGCLRVGSFTTSFGFDALHVWKGYMMEWFALACGCLFLANPRYRRWGVYAAALFMLLHAVLALQYVGLTGLDLRMSAATTAGSYGLSGFWQPFATVTVLLLGYLLSETNKWIRFAGFACLPLLYLAIVCCGFATSLAIFLLGHVVMGVGGLLIPGMRRGGRLIVKIVVSALFVAFACAAFMQVVRSVDDRRLVNIQWRFRNLLEAPKGGGYREDASRFSLMSVGWDSFKEAPVLGTGGMFFRNPATRGHHAVVDYLAVYGLIGGGAYILFLLMGLRNTIRRYRRAPTWTHLSMVSAAVMYLVGGIVNPTWYGVSTMVFYFYVIPLRSGNEQGRIHRCRPMVPRWRS